MLDPLSMGELVHRTLERALRGLETGGGLAGAGEDAIVAAVDAAAKEIAAEWERERGAPPRIVWQRTLEEARTLGARALSFRDGGMANARAYGEVPFGGSEPRSDAAIPWDPAAAVAIPGRPVPHRRLHRPAGSVFGRRPRAGARLQDGKGAAQGDNDRWRRGIATLSLRLRGQGAAG